MKFLKIISLGLNSIIHPNYQTLKGFDKEFCEASKWKVTDSNVTKVMTETEGSIIIF